MQNFIQVLCMLLPLKRVAAQKVMLASQPQFLSIHSRADYKAEPEGRCDELRIWK